MLYANVCGGDWLDILLLASRDRVEWMLIVLKTAGGWRRAMGGCSSPKTFL